ncbi:hypothetical protein OEB99_03980 [Actinotalea sp. M2MS4P-6]|uniref:hypothetical protein n=1 Tax=Actinotalea sp. M2MS4P-6 TaxID=2983762 RepID=UPI0021E4D41B|nr:hypothetical protein [Actinotalea sp. M2MS4P-6]MCV2393457.1 hypothetical protein [Actinotalea sp. M2MS4P-6]
MLVAAVLIPPTALLVPGAAGRADVLVEERRVAREAVAGLVAAGPEAVVVVVPGATRLAGTDLRPSLSAAGVGDRWSVGSENQGPVVTDVPASVALWLLAQAGWGGPVEVIGVAGADPEVLAAPLRGPGRVAAVVVGGGSVRHGADAPLAGDPEATDVDGALVDWLHGLTGGPHPPVPDGALVAHHHLDAVAPARVLAAALPGSGLGFAGVTATAPFGATYLVASWRATASAGGVDEP